MSTKPLQSASGVQKKIYTASAKREFDGVDGMGGMDEMGWMGWDGTEVKMGPPNFFTLCGYIVHLYMNLYTCSKFVTKFVMGWKI